MIRKNKIIIGVSIVSVAVLIVGLILGGLDRLDAQKYGLNYNYITANFSNSDIYTGGLFLVGPSNVLLQIPKTYQTISLQNIKTYTQDFFPLTISAQVSYLPIISGNNTDYQDFKILRNFYINFGDKPQIIMQPIMRNQLIKIASSYSSSNYQNTDISKTIQQLVASAIATVLNKWTNVSVTVLISSIACKGMSLSMESYTRQINGLTAQAQRIQARKTDMSTFMDSLLQSAQFKMTMIVNAIQSRIATVRSLQSSLSGTFNVSRALEVLQTTGDNLQYASSSLLLRPQLYNLANTNDTKF